MKKSIFSTIFFVAIVFLGGSYAENCTGYFGFWTLDRVNNQRKNYREEFYDSQLKSEIRGYYEIFTPKDVYLEQDYGRIKDSVGKCFSILDTTIQLDENGAPKGRITTGIWFELPPIIQDFSGTKVMREINNDLGKYDTIDFVFQSSSPKFMNKNLFPSTAIWNRVQSKKKGPMPKLIYGFLINGKIETESKIRR